MEPSSCVFFNPSVICSLKVGSHTGFSLIVCRASSSAFFCSSRLARAADFLELLVTVLEADAEDFELLFGAFSFPACFDFRESGGKSTFDGLTVDMLRMVYVKSRNNTNL